MKKKRLRLGHLVLRNLSKTKRDGSSPRRKTRKKKLLTLNRTSAGKGLKIVFRSREISHEKDPIPLPSKSPPAPPAEPTPPVVHLPEVSTSNPPSGTPLLPGFIENKTLSTLELVRPADSLKQSIEGFLLDQRSEHTRLAYSKDLKRFVMFLHARNFQQGPAEITRTLLIAYKESLLSEGLEHTTVDRHLATLRSFFKWLVDDGLILRSPAEGVRFLNPRRLSTTIGFTDEEVKKVLSMPDLHTRVGSLHYAILMVLFYCGLRRSEACSLRTTHLGTERNQRVFRLRGKGNAERIIVMIPPVWNAIRHLFFITRRDLTLDQPLFMPIRNNRTKSANKPLDPSMIFYIVTKYAKQAGIQNRVSPHSCRATAISNARDHHVPDRAIQEFAGWASPDMITRYDKRRSAIEDSAAHSIFYGAENRLLPETSSDPVGASAYESTASSSKSDQTPDCAADLGGGGLPPEEVAEGVADTGDGTPQRDS